MTTALSIINRAAELIGYKDPDESLSGNDSSNFLGVLNSMVDSWNTDRLYIVSTEEVTASVSGSPITIGAGASIDVARPVRVEDGSFVRISNVDYPIRWVTQEQFNSIASKDVTGSFPEYGYYEPSLPTGSISLWPVPASTVELHLVLMTQLSEFADIATEYDLAPGYKRALEYSLAEELAIGRRPLDPQIARIAASARKKIKTANFEPPQLSHHLGLTRWSQFVSGQ